MKHRRRRTKEAQARHSSPDPRFNTERFYKVLKKLSTMQHKSYEMSGCQSIIEPESQFGGDIA